MTSFKKTIALACAASVLSFGVAVAQTAPAAPDAPAAGDAAAPAADAPAMKPMKPMKKTMKTSSKKMTHKSAMKKKAM